MAALRKGREETARLAQQEKDHRIQELKARLAVEESTKPQTLETKKRRKESTKEKKSNKKKVRFSEETTTIPPKGVEVDFTPVTPVAAEELIQEAPMEEDDWDEDTEEDIYPGELPPVPLKALPPPEAQWRAGRKGYPLTPEKDAQGKYIQVARNAAGGVSTFHVDKLYKGSQPNPFPIKRVKPTPQPPEKDGSTSPSFFGQVVDGVKHHGAGLVSRGASQLAVFALGGVLLVAKSGLERMAQKHFQPTQTNQPQGYMHPPPSIQSIPSTPTPPQFNNYPVQQTGYQSLESSPFGPQWRP
jgi:hypothetical protein